MGNSIFLGERFTDRTLIESIVSSFYIIDYGIITTINGDKTVNVEHAKKLVTSSGQVLPPTRTNNIEMLTVAGSGFSVNFDYEKGDKVLLLGLKDTVEKVGKILNGDENKSHYHYSRETLKAIPLCVFNDQAKVKIQIEKGALSINTQDKIKLNGDNKQFVTWNELNNALTQFLTGLTTALTTTAIIGNGSPQPTWTGLPTSIDISAAKTTTVVTGG